MERLTAMPNEEINKAIAESMGWEQNTQVKTPYYTWYDPEGIAVISSPDYTSDLNAMHKVEESLSEDEWGAMFGEMVTIRWREATIEQREGLGLQKALSPARATARQRAEAYSKTKGLWKTNN